MIELVKKSLLKDSPDYEEPTKNVAKLSKEELKDLHMKECMQTGVCNCKCKGKK